jgi:hypothetical protein
MYSLPDTLLAPSQGDQELNARHAQSGVASRQIGTGTEPRQHLVPPDGHQVMGRLGQYRQCENTKPIRRQCSRRDGPSGFGRKGRGNDQRARLGIDSRSEVLPRRGARSIDATRELD